MAVRPKEVKNKNERCEGKCLKYKKCWKLLRV